MDCSDAVFKERYTSVLILPMQERSRERALYYLASDQKLKQKLKNKQTARQKNPKNINNKTVSFKKDKQVTM